MTQNIPPILAIFYLILALVEDLLMIRHIEINETVV